MDKSVYRYYYIIINDSVNTVVHHQIWPGVLYDILHYSIHDNVTVHHVFYELSHTVMAWMIITFKHVRCFSATIWEHVVHSCEPKTSKVVFTD